MQAEKVWQVWRRIMREAPLAEAVHSGAVLERAWELGLGEEEARIAGAYADSGKRAEWFVTNYRYRLVSSVGYALETCAPLTWRVLMAHDFEPRELGERVLDGIGWQDDGPFVYRMTARILAFLDRELSPNVHGLADTIAVDRASVALIRTLSTAPEESPLRSSGRLDEAAIEKHASASDEAPLVCTGMGAIAKTAHQLSDWLRKPAAIGREALTAGPQTFLVYLPNFESTRKIARLSMLGSSVFELLEKPCSRGAIEAALGREAGDTALTKILRQLLAYGVVRAQSSS